MSYPGNPATFPVSIPLVDDGIVPDGSELSVPLEGLADRTAYLKARLSAVNGDASIQTFVETFAVTWTAGPYDRRIEIEGFGGGGGGGGGGNGSGSLTWHSSGGGGGGGSLRSRRVLSVTPGTVYEVIVGAGGNAGIGGVDGGAFATPGGNGGDTIFRVQGGATLAVFKGARGGARGNGVDSNTLTHIVPGGGPTDQPRPNNQFRVPFDENSTTFCYGPGFGGDGTSYVGVPISRKGADAPDGSIGGAGGTAGTAHTYPGGGPGGGGAAGPGGNGFAGLNGGDGDAAVGQAGQAFAGIFTDDNTGCGGGGGGGGGSAPSGGPGSDGIPGRRGFLSLRVIG